MEHLRPSRNNEIEKIHAHLDAGHQILIATEGGRQIIINPKQRDYINAATSGEGYNLGWDGQHKVFVFPFHVFFVEPGYEIKPTRRRRK